MSEYLTVQEIAEAWELTPRRIQILCNEGKIIGAVKFGKIWAIPTDVQRPVDKRIKTGEFRKNKD